MKIGNLAASMKVRGYAAQIIIMTIIVVILLLTFIPLFLMVFLSLKSNAGIYASFWTLPIPPRFENYNAAYTRLLPNMINSLIIVTVSTATVVTLASVSGYTFARLTFPGKQALYFAILSLMMIPGVLTLTPQFKLMQDFRLTNTWWALFFPWVAGGQVMGIMLCRTFIESQPAALFESARIDGANELTCYFLIAMPLAKPILTTLAIMNMNGFYNDFIWPLMVIDNTSKTVITVAIRVFQSQTGSTQMGNMIAGFVISSVPLLVLFLFGSRLYIEGVTSGAVKM